MKIKDTQKYPTTVYVNKDSKKSCVPSQSKRSELRKKRKNK